MFNKNNLLKLNLMSYHGNKRNLKGHIQLEIVGDLNGSKSD